MSLLFGYKQSAIGLLSESVVSQGFSNIATLATETDLTYKVNPGKWAAIPAIFIILLICCLLPHVLIRWKQNSAVSFALIMLTCISGGAMLSIGLTHIIPHSSLYFQQYFTPEECRADHSAHGHFVVKPLDPEYIDLVPIVNTSPILSQLSSLTSSNPSERLTLTPAQSTNPVDPSVPPTDTHAECEQGEEFYPYAEMLAGLVVLLLMAVESLLHVYLSSRGNNSVHLHVHGDGQCGHNHTHHHPHDETGKPISPNEAQDDNTPAPVDDRPENNSSAHGVAHLKIEPNQQDVDDQAVEMVSITPQDQDSKPSDFTKIPIKHKDGEHGEQDLENLEDDVGHYKPEHINTPEEEQIQQFRRTIDAYISVIAIGLHCIFNGLALGSISISEESQIGAFWTLFGVTVAHKFCDGFAVGIPLMRANLSKITTGILIFLLCIATPIGIIIGYFATESSNSDGKLLSQAVLLGLSSGSFFYIALLELIPNGVADGGKKYILWKWGGVFFGFAIPAVIANWA